MLNSHMFLHMRTIAYTSSSVTMDVNPMQCRIQSPIPHPTSHLTMDMMSVAS